MSDLVGQQLGVYRLLRMLGEGSFASVYLGEPVSSGESLNASRQVAIKVFHTPISSQEGELLRQDEALLTHLKHPNLVRVFAFGLQDSTAFLVMAYVPGGTLRERHPADSRLELATIGTYVQQIASALQYLHDAHLVHGNLKPENILVAQENQVLLSDFTTPLMAQRLRTVDSPEATRTRTYLAPESIQGRRDPASDQYALAILVYEWLTGQPPFAGSVDEVSTQHLFATPASLRQQLPSVPAAVEQVVLTALAKDPRQRFASVLDFAAAFLSAAGLPAAAAPLVEVDEPVSALRPERPEAPVAIPAAETPLSLFISYAHADSPFVDRLEADLQQQGFDPWVDRQRLKGGQRWRRELQDAVKRAQVLLLVLSPDAVASQNVQIEYEYVLELGKVVIPLYYRQCEVPMELRAIQWIDFRHSYEQGLSALLDVLHRHQEHLAARSSPPRDAAGLPEGRPASPASTEAASSLPAQQPAAPARSEPLWKVPGTLTSLVGREQEVAEITALLKQPEARLLTLLGAGGIGKTRLGIAVATQMRDYFVDGICFVGLAAINDPQMVMPTIAQELGLKESGARSLLEQVQAFVGERSFLLVLDNFEQVAVAAPTIEGLLANCPNLKTLVTSRAVLHLSAEQVVPVAPLVLPDLAKGLTPEGIAQSAAVMLFVQRARSQLPSFQLTPANAQAIAEVCVRLDGLPLAIELAAARVRLLPPQALLSHLKSRLQVLTGGPRSLPARQQTLRNTLQWSYDLLGSEEQALFRLLAVFVGGWQLSAAEALARGTGQVTLDVLNTLSALLDNSLIQQGEQEEELPRFRMLQIVREYGMELLDASGERETTQAAHARYFLALAEQARPELDGPNQMAWLQRLEQEHDNLRAALEWALQEEKDERASERRELALRLSAPLEPFWEMRGYYSEAHSLLERVVASSEGQSASLRIKVLPAAAYVALLVGNQERAEALAKLGLALSRELGDTRGMARSLFVLARLAWIGGKTAEAISLSEEMVKLIRPVGGPAEVAEALYLLGFELSTHGEFARGQALFEEGLALSRKAGNELWVGAMLIASASWLWTSLGERATIRQRLQEGQALVTKLGNPYWIAVASYVAAALAWSEGELTEAASLAQEALAFSRKTDNPWYTALTLQLLGAMRLFEGDLTAALHSYQESLAVSREMRAKYIIALDLEALGLLALKQEAPGRAAQLWGAAEALREVTALPMPPAIRAIYVWAVSEVRTQLGEEAFAAAWQEGRAMPLEQVIEDVLKWDDVAGRQ